MQRAYLVCGAASLMLLFACDPAVYGVAVSLDSASAAVGARTCLSTGGYNLDGSDGNTYKNPKILVRFQKGSNIQDSPATNTKLDDPNKLMWNNTSGTISPDDTYTAKAWMKVDIYKGGTYITTIEIGSNQTIQVPIPGV